MAQKLKEWLRSPEIKKLQKCSNTELLTTHFFRDPIRPLYYNSSVFLSPADGTILYAYNNIGPDEKIVEVKGRNFTVRDLLHDKSYNKRSLVIGIFMSILDVHINRMPTDGYIGEVIETPCITSHNTSMLALENGLFYQSRFNPNNAAYLFQNEKLITVVTCPIIKSKYYVIQIADKDVNAIINYAEGDFMQQGERFGNIRWGSQVDLVIPLEENSELEYQILVEPLLHVEGGVDKLVKVVPLSNRKEIKKGIFESVESNK